MLNLDVAFALFEMGIEVLDFRGHYRHSSHSGFLSISITSLGS